MKNYETIFDISNQGFSWWFAATGFVFVMIAIGIIVGHSTKGSNPKTHQQNKSGLNGGIAMLAFSLLWTSSALLVTYGSYSQCQELYKSSKTITTEGVIQDFRPSSGGSGTPPEQFTVNRFTFSYHSRFTDCGLNDTFDKRGPLKNGIRARVTFIPDSNNTIVRLEIEE